MCKKLIYSKINDIKTNGAMEGIWQCSEESSFVSQSVSTTNIATENIVSEEIVIATEIVIVAEIVV